MNIKKKILKIICIEIVIIFSMFLIRGIIFRVQIEKDISLTKEERKKLNYKELIEDIGLIKKGNRSINAKIKKENEKKNDSKSKISIIFFEEFYGDGYYIIEDHSYMDAIGYRFYTTDDKLIYEYVKNAGMVDTNSLNYKFEMIQRNSFNIVIFGVIIVGIISCIIQYKKYKKITEMSK